MVVQSDMEGRQPIDTYLLSLMIKKLLTRCDELRLSQTYQDALNRMDYPPWTSVVTELMHTHVLEYEFGIAKV
jgi:hypothetical protein